MAETSKTTPTNKLPHGGDHDRVVMASLKADGTADQTPDFAYIGDKEVAVEAAKEQRAQQAVSAADVAERTAAAASTDDRSQDPDVAERVKEHERVADAARKAAEADVNARHEDVAAS